MKTWTIGKRITFGFSLLLAMLICFAGVVWIQMRRLDQCIVGITTDNLPGLRYTGELISQTLEYRVINMKHLNSESAAEKIALDKEADEQAKKILATFDEYKKTIVAQEELSLAEKVVPALNEYRMASKKMRELNNAGQTVEADAMIKPVEEIYNAFEKTVNDCGDYNDRASDKSAAVAVSAFKTSEILTVICVIVALTVGITFAILITRSIGNTLRRIAAALDDGSNQVSAAAGQVAAASQTLAEGASEQAASLEETSSSLEEMASMTRQNSENAEKANNLARQARLAADTGASDMQQMNAAMEGIKESSDDIAKIIKTIDEIAFQTNILALNAAVEAARAGEAGMGFAVVADEVRNLAQRCAQSAKETSTKIEGAIAKTAQGVDISTKVTQGLNEIVTKARQVDELVSEVSSASKEQSQGVSQVNAAVGQMDKVTQSNAASAEESASAAEELNAQAQSLKEAVVELMQLVGGSRNGRQSAAPDSTASARSLQTAFAAPAHRTAFSRGIKTNPEPVLSAARKSEKDLIPMDGDFKDM